MRYFEGIVVGEKRSLGPRPIERASMLAFANEFDRQPFHVDEAAAKESIYQGLIASGIHTLAITTSLIVDEYLQDKAVVAGLGIDQLRFLHPVRAGDLLTVDLEVCGTAPHPREGMGIVRVMVTTRNQHGKAVVRCLVEYGFSKDPTPRPQGAHA